MSPIPHTTIVVFRRGLSIRNFAAPAMDPQAANTISLDQLPEAGRATVTGVEVPADPAARTLALRLLELGFVPGEQVHMVRVVHPSGEPLAVRLGHTTFALRRSEAVLIQVIPAA